MATFTELLPARKTNRHAVCRFTPSADEYGPTAGLLEIETERAGTVYRVEEFPTGWEGRGFRLTKVTGGEEAYFVFCSQHGAEGDSCDCKGMTYAGNCKHTDSVRACVGNGWL